MNLNVLGISVMVLITREWLSNPVIVAEIQKHPLGAALWTELARIHKRVSEFRRQRMSLEAALAELTEQITHHGELHDRKARALHNLLLYMAEATNDPALARKLRDLDALLFPDQLRIRHMSHFEKAGAIIELEQRVTPEDLGTLESLPLGDQTLADIYREWVAAGHELGRHAQQRARVAASLSAHGSASPQTHARKVRSAWIRGVRLLLDSLDMLELSDVARERLLAPLQKGVRDASLRRSQNTEPSIEPIIEPSIEPIIELNTEPSIEPIIEPSIQPDIQPGIELAVEPGIQPTPPGQPGLRPLILPMIESGDPPRSRSTAVSSTVRAILPMIESGSPPHGIMRAAPPPRPSMDSDAVASAPE